MRRRLGIVRRTLPWLLAAGLIGFVGFGVVRAWGTRDPVRIAEALRKGDVEAGRAKDPISAIEVLDRVLDDDPRNVAALIERARAMQDLRAWDKAIDCLVAACNASETAPEKILAKTMQMSLLATADRYDDAVKVGHEIVALAPEEPVHKLRLGPIYLKGSQSAQEEVLKRFMDRTARDLSDRRIEDRVESFITNLWSETDAAEVVAALAPQSDAVFRQQVSDNLAMARERFRLADQTLASFTGFGGFEPAVARAFCQVLERSGRLFDAHVEAGMALRESVPTAFKRDFLEVQARCAIAVEDWLQAATLYGRIVDAYLADPQQPQVPFAVAWSMYETRIRSAQWDWILAHVDADAEKYGKDEAIFAWARAAALAGKAQVDEARQALLDPYAVVSRGSRAYLPGSLKLYPERRRDIALLAYQLFTATGNSEAAGALDALLGMDPTDPDALRLRSDANLAAGDFEGAAADALALLVPERRDRADFDRWLHACNALSEERHGNGLAERAQTRVNNVLVLKRGSVDAAYQSWLLMGKKGPKPAQEAIVDQLYVRSEPALSFQIIEELLALGEVERARTELRKLSEDQPQVQEFRFRLGKLLVREGQFDFAATEFRALLDAMPGDTEALDFAVRTELAMDRPDEAAAFVTRTILADPLGAGAVRYGARLLERDRVDQARRLVERLARIEDYGGRQDVLLLAARTNLAEGKLDDAAAILATLATAYPDSFDVALLGLDVGLAKDQPGLVQAAVASMRPIAPELFPDQLHDVAQRLLDAGLFEELVSIFDETVCTLPAAQFSLREVAQAHKALGQPAQADLLLAELEGDSDAITDRFLLLSLQGQPDEASRRMRLQPEADPLLRERTELCLLAGNALMDLRALQDGEPGRRLGVLHAEATLDPASLELYDGLLRLLPSVTRLQEVLPATVIEDPRSIYPHAGRDIEALVALARSDPPAARRACSNLLCMLLMQDRPFWASESRALAEQALSAVPGLVAPSRTLARRELEAGNAREALALLQPLLGTDAPDPADLRLFLQAARDFDHAEWGVALALFFEDQPAQMTVLADTMAEWGHADEALKLYDGILAAVPDDAHALAGRITAYNTLHRNEELVKAVEQAIGVASDDPEVVEASADALAGLFRPDARALGLMQFFWNRNEDLDQVGEALARATTDEAQLEPLLERLAERSAARLTEDDPDRAAIHSQALVRAARTARNHGFLELARELNELALRSEPGAIALYRELGLLELQLGHLETARSYLEVLSFVDVEDRDAAMELARLDFRQLGQPVRAADVVRRTFTGTVPPDMVEILAAEAWLLGRPQDAINEFIQVSRSPLVSADTYMTVFRIAYAAALDDVARFVADLVLANAAPDDPRRVRVQFIVDRKLQTKPAVKPTAAAP